MQRIKSWPELWKTGGTTWDPGELCQSLQLSQSVETKARSTELHCKDQISLCKVKSACSIKYYNQQDRYRRSSCIYAKYEGVAFCFPDSRGSKYWITFYSLTIWLFWTWWDLFPDPSQFLLCKIDQIQGINTKQYMSNYKEIHIAFICSNSSKAFNWGEESQNHRII